MAETQRSPAADRAAAVDCCSGKTSTTKYSTRHRQVYDADGHTLLRRPGPIDGAPRRATPGWYRLAANRWAEVTS